MKKLALLLVFVLLFASVLCSCTPKTPANDISSGIANADDTSSAASDERTQWKPEEIPAPTKVDGFDAIITVGSDDTDPTNATLYYKGKAYSSGSYNYIGSHNGRHYFQGYENYENNYANYGYVCSCDENYENFERYDGIHIDFGPEQVMYKGILYGFKEGDLYSYDISTKTKKLVYDGKYEVHGLIQFISNGWVFSDEKPAINVNTGETVNIPIKNVIGLDKDGLVWGYETANIGGLAKNLKIQTFNMKTGEIKNVRELENICLANIQRDDNGDVWLQDSSSTLGYGYIKMFDFDGDDIVFARDDSHLSNGYFYYSYSPEDTDKRYIARINLETGKTEYCENMPAGVWLNVSPYFWGYYRPQSK